MEIGEEAEGLSAVVCKDAELVLCAGISTPTLSSSEESRSSLLRSPGWCSQHHPSSYQRSCLPE